MVISDPKWDTEGAKGTFIAFAAVAVWSSVPLTIRIFITLKRRRTLYFLAMLTTTWGLCLREIGYMFKYLAAPSTPWLVSNILAQLGWVAMVSGFACVLYSRLNLIVESRAIRRGVLGLVVGNAVVWHPMMITLSLGLSALARDPVRNQERIARWARVFRPMERVQLVMFSGQETLISCFYVRAAYQYLRSRFVQEKKVKSAMFLLLGVQAVVVGIDIGLVVIDFLGFLTLKLFVHSFVYCVKLELEFVVLNQLVELSQLGVPGLPSFSLGKSGSGARDVEMNRRHLPESSATAKNPD